MKKKYFVLMLTEKWGCEWHTKSLRLAMWLANLSIWKYAKIHEIQYGETMSKCIFIMDRRES